MPNWYQKHLSCSACSVVSFLLYILIISHGRVRSDKQIVLSLIQIRLIYIGNVKIVLQYHASGLSWPLSCFCNSAEKGKQNNSLTKALQNDTVLGRGWEENFEYCGWLAAPKMCESTVLPPLIVLACVLQKYLIQFFVSIRLLYQIFETISSIGFLCCEWEERERGVWGSSLLTV